MRETNELYFRESMQTGRTDHRKFRTTSPQFFWKSDPFLWRIGNQEQAQTVADHFAFNVVPARKTRCHLVAFCDWNWGWFISSRNAKWNRKFLFHSILNRNLQKFWLNGTHLRPPGLPECSDFVTNCYGESWDSFHEKSWVPVQNQWVPVWKPVSPIILKVPKP